MTITEVPSSSTDLDASSAVTVSPVTGRTGAVIGGVRLGGDLRGAEISAIRDALLRYKVVFFRDQAHLDDDSHQAFAGLLGTPTQHPTIRWEGTTVTPIDSATGVRANVWHTDVTFVADYPAFSILRSEIVPEAGGDTLWANTVAAYADLPPALAELADKLWALHTNAFDYATAYDEGDNFDEYREKFASTEFQTEHPLVRVHPETLERSLVLGGFAKQILGVSPADSTLLLQLFSTYIQRPENQVRWRWQPGDVAIWDNRATQHYAPNDYGDDDGRLLNRVTVAGDVPVSVDGQDSIVRVGADSDWYAR